MPDVMPMGEYTWRKNQAKILDRLLVKTCEHGSGAAMYCLPCQSDVEAAPDGSLYYANASEIRRLLPGATGTPGSPSG